MKKQIKNIAVFLGAMLVLGSCELTVLQDPKAFTQDKAQDATGAYLSAVGAIKAGFDAHQRMAWAAGMVGNEELESVLDNTITQYGLRLEKENILAKDNTYNRGIVSAAYQGLALSDNARQAVNKNTLSTKGKALLLANINLIEGMIYGDMAKFYSKVIEFGTGAEIDPAAAKTKALGLLQEAIAQYKAAAAITDAAPEKLTGLFVDPVIAQKFLNSYIAMIHFDTGTKAQAGAFLDQGYVAADAGKEIGIININSLTGVGLYPEWRNGVEFQLNGYSQKFIDNRIPVDTLRRAPAKWFTPGKNIALASNRVVMNYFYPQSPLTATTPAGGATLAAFPLITWQEVALMSADPAVNKATASTVIENVLISWKVPAATAKTLSTTLALDRVARYEYAGRGRRWSAVGTYAKWEVANEFNFK